MNDSSGNHAGRQGFPLFPLRSVFQNLVTKNSLQARNDVIY